MPRVYSEEAGTRALGEDLVWGQGLCVPGGGVGSGTLRAQGLRMVCVQLEVLPGPPQSLS